jgi:hypothetical protein
LANLPTFLAPENRRTKEATNSNSRNQFPRHVGLWSSPLCRNYRPLITHGQDREEAQRKAAVARVKELLGEARFVELQQSESAPRADEYRRQIEQQKR